MEHETDYQVPFDVDAAPDALADDDTDHPEPQAWDPGGGYDEDAAPDAAHGEAWQEEDVAIGVAEPGGVAEHDPSASPSWPEDDQASGPFIGQWNRLISSTNWEKGRIICQWRSALVDAGAPSTAYSDEAWAQRVGGVTAPHVGRLRRVYAHFAETYSSYPGLYWSHFLAALDWDDAPLWLEGAMRSGWSVSQMRLQRWEAQGGRPEDRPGDAEIVAADTDEDVNLSGSGGPAQGGGRSSRIEDDPDAISARPGVEGPDFGDEPYPASAPGRGGGEGDDPSLAEPQGDLVQPFAGLPELPDDLSEALEQFKLAILRHKASQWKEVSPETIQRVLDALRTLVEARGA